ncbi:MAG: sugar phosphate isomerase/epimerase, partial [Oscillospiraceae bacterium]|nr:sugar phosphate isomerase/epimerase [Oscillospiraceae bacterium]
MLSIFNWFGYRELTHAEGFRLIRQAGFEGVLLWWAFAEGGENYRKQPELARQAGLWVENIHANFEQANHLWEDTQAGQAVYEYYLQCVEDCAAFRVPSVVMHPGAGGSMPPVSEIGLQRFERLLDRAGQRGVNIALENMRRPACIERGALLLERFDSPRLGFCYDNGHHHARHTKEADTLAQFGHRLMSLHLSDNAGKDDLHQLPFDGTIGWPAQMRKIAETGYQGPTALEVTNYGYEET